MDNYCSIQYFSYIWLQLRLICVQYINADITFFANAFAFPFCTMVFALPFMKFLIPEQSQLTIYHIISIIILFFGLIVYGIGERKNKESSNNNLKKNVPTTITNSHHQPEE